MYVGGTRKHSVYLAFSGLVYEQSVVIKDGFARKIIYGHQVLATRYKHGIASFVPLVHFVKAPIGEVEVQIYGRSLQVAAVGSLYHVEFCFLFGKEIDVGAVAFALQHPPARCHIGGYIEVVFLVSEYSCLLIFCAKAHLIATYVHVDSIIQIAITRDRVGLIAPRCRCGNHCPEAIILSVIGINLRVDL